MNALILAAGYGTRLAAIAKNKPKPLLEVAGKSLIDHCVDKLKPVKGLEEVVVVTNNKFYDQFIEWAKTHTQVKVRIVNDGTNSPEDRLGSVGDIDFVWSKEKQPKDWLILGGDNLFDQDMNQFMTLAREKSPAMTVGMYDIGDIAAATKFGVMSVDKTGKVTELQEKPAKPATSLISMCMYYFPKETLGYVLEYKRTAKNLDTAGSYIQWLVQNKNVYGFQFRGKWYDIGSIESLEEAQKHYQQ